MGAERPIHTQRGIPADAELVRRRFERNEHALRMLKSRLRSTTVQIYDADFPLDGVDGEHALRLTADPPMDPAETAGFYYRNGKWFQHSPGPFVYGGTAGDDGVDAKLAANPHPYATGDTPGPPPFLNGISNGFYVDALGNVGDGLRFRVIPHGIQLDCGGGLSGVADNTAIMQLPWGPDTVKADVAAFVDGSGGFFYTLDPDGILTYVRALA